MLKILYWSWMIILALVCIACLIAMVWLMKPKTLPLSRRDRIKRSIAGGLFTGVGIASILMAAFMLAPNYHLSIESVSILLCLAIPAQLMATIGTYVQLGYLQMYHQALRRIVETQERKSP